MDARVDSYVTFLFGSPVVAESRRIAVEEITAEIAAEVQRAAARLPGLSLPLQRVAVESLERDTARLLCRWIMDAQIARAVGEAARRLATPD